MKTSVIWIAMMLLFSACKKNEKPEKQDTQVANKTTVALQLFPQYELNMYDAAGYRHNEMLRYMRKYKTGDAQLPTEQIADLLIQNPAYGLSISMKKPMLASMQQLASAQEAFYDQVVAAISLSVEAKQYLNVIVGAIRQHFGMNYHLMKNAITAVEDQVLNHIELPQMERVVILMTASIARYSAYYWMFEEPISLAGLSLKSWLKVIATVTADPAGFLQKWVPGGNGFNESVAYGAACSEYQRTMIDYIPNGH